MRSITIWEGMTATEFAQQIGCPITRVTSMLADRKHFVTPQTMLKLTEGTFEWAMLQMRQGKTIRRKSRPLLRFCLSMSDSVHNELGMSDFLATDWEIVPELKPKPEGHDFMWAVEQMRNGKRVRRKAWGMWPALVSGQFVSVTDADQKDWILEPEGESR